MGASVAPVEVRFSATGIDAVRAGMRSVREEAQGLGAGTAAAGKEVSEGLSHGAIFGLAEFSRGLGRIAETGQASALGMRELSGGVMRLGQSLGPGAGLIGIFAILGGIIVSTFMKAREEMQKTQTEFNDRLIEMTRSLAVAQLAGTNGIVTQLFSGDAAARALLKGPAKTNGDIEALKKLGISTGNEDLAFIARTRGTEGLRAALPGMQAAVDAIGGPFRQGSKEADKVREAMALLKEMEDQSKRATEAANLSIKTMVDQVTAGIKIASEKKDLKNIFNPPGDDFANLITGEQFQRSALKHMLPGQIGDMNRSLIDQLKQELDVEMLKGNGAKTTDERMEALKKYAEILKQIDDLTGKPGELGVLGGKGPKAAKITPTETQSIVEDFQKNVNEPLGRAIKDGLAKTLGSAIADGITAGFQSRSIGGAFKGMGKAILSGLGSIFEQMGETMITYGIAATGFAKAMLNPLTAGPAAIAYGALLVALGASLGAIAQGGSGGGYGGGSSSLPSIITTTYLTSGNAGAQGANMSPKGSGTNNFWVIGTDPKAWRDVQEQLDRNARLSGPGR